MTHDKELNKIITELEYAAEIAGDELGEFWTSLIDVYRHRDYGMSDSFAKACEKEIRAEYKRFKKDFVIETVKLTHEYEQDVLKHKDE